MGKFKRFFRYLTAIAAILFGIQQVGGNPLSPGPDLGFEWRSANLLGQRVLSLRTDSGNLDSWIWLKLRCRKAAGLSAKLSDGTPLEVLSVPASDGQAWSVEIFRAGSTRHAKFSWPSGTELFLIHDKESMEGAEIQDWKVHTASGKDDTKYRELWRQVWLGASMLILFMVIAGVFVKEDTPPRPAVTPELFILMAIEGMEGSSPEETQKIQTLLKEVVLEGARAEDALASVTGGSREFVLWFKARGQFLHRLDNIIDMMQKYRRRAE